MAHIQTESEWELEMCGKIVDYLAGKIYVDMRFMEPVLNVLVPRANMGLSTFATDGVYLYMNTRHTMDVFRKNENFLVRMYLHSVLHCVYSHIRNAFVKIENGKVTNYFQVRNSPFSHHHA